MQIIWLGHASFKIKAEGKVIYIDPYGGEDEFYNEGADVVLISHSHFDHCDGGKIKMIRTDHTHMYTPEDIVYRFGSIKIEAGLAFMIDRIRITAVKAYNVDKPNHPDDFGVGYVIEAEGKKLYFAGDTDLIPEMDDLDVDIALLPVGGTYTMNAEEAAEAAKKIKCRVAIPMHWGYGLVGRIEDAEMFKELLEKDEIRVEILEPGREFDL